MKKIIKCSFLGATLLAAPAMQAATISVNFTHSAQGVTNLAPGDVAGLEAVNNWNNRDTGAAPLNDLKNDSGVVTTTDLTAYNNAFWKVTNVNNTTKDYSMMSGYINSPKGSSGESTTIAIENLGTDFTSNGYKVIVYIGGTDALNASFAEYAARIDGVTSDVWIRATEDSYAGSYASTTYASEAFANASGTSSNYIEITGLTAASFDLVITEDTTLGNNLSRVAIRGFQVVAVPEPSSTALLGLGGLALILRRRK